MTLNELIERLEEIRDEVSGNIQVLGAFQPNYPLIANIDAVTTLISDDSDRAGVYIALSDGNSYGSRDLWDDDFIERDEDEDEDED
jgi:hypothetical protein